MDDIVRAYVLFYADFAVYGASTSQDASTLKYWDPMNDLRHEGCGLYEYHIPERLAEDLSRQNTGGQAFEDGYEAQAHLSSYKGILVASENWDEESGATGGDTDDIL